VRILSALALTAALAAAAAVSALGSNSGGAGTTRPRTTVRVLSDSIVTVEIDSDQDGKWSLGDLRVSRWIDLDSLDGTRIGEGNALCTAVDVARSLVSCTGSDALPGGTIVWHGVRDDSPAEGTYRLAITGGTGKYRRASGHKSVDMLTATTSKDTYVLGANGLDPSLDSKGAHDYMGRPPEEFFTQIGMPCVLWSGGFVPDPDPWWKKNGGKRATWIVQLCWTA
jgi:hypothetical protein